MWIVDTCVVLDVFENDPRLGRRSAELLQRLVPHGLGVSPVTMVELAAAFRGDLVEQKRFLDQAGIAHDETWTSADTESAYQAWNAYVSARRQSRASKPPIADILIGAFAVNRTGLVTRYAADFGWFAQLKVREP